MIHVQSIIDRAIEKNNQIKGGSRNSDFFHVSDAGTCYRKRFYKRFGAVSGHQIPIANLRKMVAGDAGHEKLQGLLAQYGNMFSAEGEVRTGHLLGHYDGIIIEGDSKSVLEIKTIEKWSMSHINGTCKCDEKGRKCSKGAKREHKLQMYTYWYHLRQHLKDLDHAVLSYVQREDFATTDFYYTWDDSIAEEVKQEWAPLIKYWENQELPPCTCKDDYNGNGVKYCQFQDDHGGCCSEDIWTDILARIPDCEEK